MDVSKQTKENYYEAELYRLRGEALARTGLASPTDVESCLHHALEIARQQQARSFELRAAMSLARLWERQGKREEGRTLLEGIYGWFTEGLDTADLKDAKALLDELR